MNIDLKGNVIIRHQSIPDCQWCDKAKEYLDEYLRLYPGNNSNDSMGEYYYFEKDYETSLKYYKKSLEHFRFSVSGNDKVRELEKLLKK